MKIKISIKEQSKETHEYATLYQDRGFFTVQAETRICYSEVREVPGLHYEEIWKTELSYFIQGKQVKWKGFIELYEKLFGVNSFAGFELNIVKEFEEYASEHYSKKYKTVASLTNAEARKCINMLVEDEKISMKTAICNNTKEKHLYSSSWLAKSLCKHHGLYSVKKLNVPYTYGTNTTEAKEHEVVILSKNQNKSHNHNE